MRRLVPVLAFALLSASLGLSSCKTSQLVQSSEKQGPSTGKATSPLTREAAAIRSRQVDRVSYILWFGLDDSHDDYQGRTVISFQMRDKERDHGHDLYVDFKDGSIRTLTVNGVITPPDQFARRYDGNRLRFKSSELLSGANRIEISFSHAYSKTGNGLHHFKDPADGQVYLYSNFEPYSANRMFPCFDQPDLKASYELTVEVPDDWKVISNTMEREVTSVDGRSSWQFPPSPSFSTYVFALHAGPYAVWKGDANGIPTRLFARKSLAQYVDHAEWLDVTAQGLEFYNVQFGYPYPYSKYDQLIVPDFNAGAMENVGAVTFSERYVHRSKVTQDQRRHRADTILHEMAHMWFGDLVTMRWWNGLWLNESFATWAAAWAVDSATRFKGSWQDFFGGMKQWAYWEDQLVTTHPIEVSVPDTDHAFANFDGITYGKGASALKQLSFFISEEDFREGLQRYFQRFAFRNTALADFMRVMSEASGMNLMDWQRAWLQTPGVNTVEASWACAPDEKTGKRKISQFTLKQGPSEFNNVLRPHRTQLAFYSTKTWKPAEKPITAEYSKAETSVTDAIGQPCPDFVYPNEADQDFVKVVLDPATLSIIRSNLSRIADPMARQMFWHTLWEMVIDGKLPARDYGELVLSQAAGEKDSQVLTDVLENLVSASAHKASVVKFADPSERESWRKKAEAFTRRGLERASEGSDLQLIWYLAFLQAAHTSRAQELLTGLLNGRQRISGLKIDQDRRWEILTALSRMGAKGASELVAAELKKDATDMGRKASIAAEASMPDAATKASWRARLVESGNGRLPDAQLREAMRAYHALGQEELSAEAMDWYFDSLPKIAATEDEEFTERFAGSMFPPLCDEKTISRATSLLKDRKLPAAAVKALKVARQEEERCIRARKVNAPAGGSAPARKGKPAIPEAEPMPPLATPSPSLTPAVQPSPSATSGAEPAKAMTTPAPAPSVSPSNRVSSPSPSPGP